MPRRVGGIPRPTPPGTLPQVPRGCSIRSWGVEMGRARRTWAQGPVTVGGGPCSKTSSLGSRWRARAPPLLALCLALWTPAHVSKSEGQPLRLTQPRAEVSTGDALRAGGLPHTILQLCSEHRIQLPPGFVTAPRGLSAPGVLCAAGQTCAHPPFLMGAEQA